MLYRRVGAPPPRHRAPRQRDVPVARDRASQSITQPVPRIPMALGAVAAVILVAAGATAMVGGMFATKSSVRTVAAPAHIKRIVLPAVPPGSGTGRRIVFDQSEQRVWLVKDAGLVQRSYLVTGSIENNVRPGKYRVLSRIRTARSYRGGGTLEFFVRFTQGRHSAIGFHAVTMLKTGQLVYSRSQLGAPHTPGCVEAWRDDSAALWAFAPVGTPVVVTA